MCVYIYIYMYTSVQVEQYTRAFYRHAHTCITVNYYLCLCIPVEYYVHVFTSSW